MNEKILIVDDEQITLDNISYILQKQGYITTTCLTGQKAVELLKKNKFDLLITDLKLPDIDGIDILKICKDLHPETEVIVITAYATIDTAVCAMKEGAYHYLTKPFKIDELRILVQKALEKNALKQEVKNLKQQLEGCGATTRFIGSSPKIIALMETIAQIALLDTTVLITGETGTGKELVAKMIHEFSPRSKQKFLAINCSVFTEELLASELFGYEAGAFTGARHSKPGLLEIANHGTILFDEIGDMPLATQVKLLRVLQERKVMRVGGTKEIELDVRIIASTNKILSYEVQEGTFRQDLYYRLNVITLEIPPLRERKEDIPLLVHHFLKKFQPQKEMKISGRALKQLMQYNFPGNVRELENIIERAVALCNSDTIDTKHLPPDLRQNISEIILPVEEGMSQEFVTLAEHEKQYILTVLEKVNGNKTKAAKILGIDRVSLWRKLKKYNLNL